MLKAYLPSPKLIPAIMLLGAVGYVVVAKALPKLIAKIAEITPAVQK